MPDNIGTKRIVLFNNVISSGAQSEAFNVEGYSKLTVYTITTGTVTSGAVTMGEATIDPNNDRVYGDPTKFAAIGSAISPVSSAPVSATHLTVGAYSYINCRVTTVIGGGGSVSVVLLCVP
jgi:hypothetical protein